MCCEGGGPCWRDLDRPAMTALEMPEERELERLYPCALRIYGTRMSSNTSVTAPRRFLKVFHALYTSAHAMRTSEVPGCEFVKSSLYTRARGGIVVH